MHFTKTKLSLGSTVRFCSANVDSLRRVGCSAREVGLTRKFISRLRCVLLRCNLTPSLPTRSMCVLSYDRSPTFFFSAASLVSDIHGHYYPTPRNSAVENQVGSFATLDPVLRKWKRACILTACLIKFQFNIIFTATPKFQVVPCFHVFRTKFCCIFLLAYSACCVPHLCYVPCIL